MKLALLAVLSLTLLAAPVFCMGDASEHGAKESLVVRDADSNPNLNAVDEKTRSASDEGFEKVSNTVIYGPLGMALKVVEFTLERLYILCD